MTTDPADRLVSCSAMQCFMSDGPVIRAVVMTYIPVDLPSLAHTLKERKKLDGFQKRVLLLISLYSELRTVALTWVMVLKCCGIQQTPSYRHLKFSPLPVAVQLISSPWRAKRSQLTKGHVVFTLEKVRKIYVVQRIADDTLSNIKTRPVPFFDISYFFKIDLNVLK